MGVGESFPNEVFEYYVEKTEVKEENELDIIASLWILRHLITRFYDKISPYSKKLFYSKLKILVDNEDFEVTMIIYMVLKKTIDPICLA